MSDPYPTLLGILVLLLLNALFAAGNEGLNTLNKALLNRKAEEGDKTAKKIAAHLDRPGYLFRASLNTGRILCKVLASALATLAFTEPLRTEFAPLGKTAASLSALLLPVLGTVVLFLLVGELFPIRATEQSADKTVYAIWNPLRFFSFIFLPIAFPVNGLVTLLLKLFGLRTDADDSLSKEEIQTIVEESGDSGLLEEQERDMLEGIFDFNEKTAEQVMTPRTDVFLINAEEPLSAQLETVLSEKYSRVPVYEGEIDNIIGILYLKDFLCEAYRVGFENVDLRNCMREVYFVPEQKPLNDLYKDLQESKNHMAVLIDEYGGFSGIVTIEDLIEEIMGDIDDEYDDSEEKIVGQTDGSFLAKGSVTIGEINEALQAELEEDDEDFDTVGGLVIKLLGYIPEEGETPFVEYEGYAFAVENVSDRRIEKVRITKLSLAENDEKGN